jgi:oligoendopeptidase F
MKYTDRKDIPIQYRWDLTPLFADDQAWEAQFAQLKTLLPEAETYRGKLADQEQLSELFALSDRAGLVFEQLYVYAYLQYYQDTRVGTYQQMVARISMCEADIAGAFSWVTPEIIASYDQRQLLELSRQPAFAAHSHELVELARQKDRVLSDKEEKILAEVTPVLGMFHETFGKYDNADVRWRPVEVDGKTVEMSHGVYGELMLSQDRKVREAAHNSMMEGYQRVINTLTSNYAGNVLGDVFIAKTRGYDSVLARALDNNNIPQAVYLKLIDKVHAAIPTLRDYMQYRKQKLGISEHKAYDMYVSTEAEQNRQYDFEESFAMVLKGLAPLGEDYIALLQKAKDERWIDVYESDGKRSGGFSWGVYGSPAYILLNYNGTLSETFTIAHELGHSMHSYYSDHSLPYASAQYRIFVAEIASTVNEMLLIKSLLKDADAAAKRYLLGYLLDMFKATVFRQTLFAEFEMQAHNVVESGGGLSADGLCDMYRRLIEVYYGEEFVTPMIQYEWARIPHFYTSFYVYQYATGLISACSIASDILEGKEGAVANYKRFLSAGGSMDALDILRLAGVDLTEDAPFDKAMRLFSDTLAELRSLS